ncbi:expressed unknown protein [Seminavis robusta]|uniref:Uncharacterized protein n=1 Tax=Seminavis robusta TaxID=568900 RepID=A0A9N8EYA5_9STRA|nr:expressed unknown protein [Seminavis robusta]|eukprot:Sro1964_g308220.1 n/a (411) ;mRNA; r:14872-16104
MKSTVLLIAVLVLMISGCHGLSLEPKTSASRINKVRFSPQNPGLSPNTFLYPFSTRSSSSLAVLFSSSQDDSLSPQHKPSFFRRLLRCKLVATICLSLLLLFGNPLSALAQPGKYDVSFWTPEMDSATTTVVSTPKLDGCMAISLDSPILSNTLSRWDPSSFSPPPSRPSAPIIMTVPRKIPTVKLAMASTMVVLAVLMGKEDVAIRLRQRASNSKEEAMTQEKTQTSTWTAYRMAVKAARQRAVAMFLMRSKQWREKFRANQKAKDKNDLQASHGNTPESPPPKTEIDTTMGDALLLTNTHQDKAAAVKRNQTVVHDEALAHQQELEEAFSKIIMDQQKLDEDHRNYTDSNLPQQSTLYGLRRSGHGERSRQTIQRAKPTVYRRKAPGWLGLQRSTSRNSTNTNNHRRN